MKSIIAQRLDKIAREVRNIVLTHGFDNLSMEINVDVSSSIFETLDRNQADMVMKLPITTYGAVGTIGWSCTLDQDIWSSSYPRIMQAKEDRLGNLIEDLAVSFRLLGLPIQASHVGLYLQPAVFKSQFVDHPNVVRELDLEVVQASLDVEGVYSVVIIGKMLIID